jgi:hypothetical protein
MRRFRVPFTFKNCSREYPVLWRFSLPAALSGSLVGPVIWICNAILVNSKSGYAALGVYIAAFQISALITTLNGMLGQSFLPICISQIKSNSLKFEFVNIVLPWTVGMFCALPFLCLPELWMMLLGSDYFNHDMLRSVVFISLSSIIVAHRQGIVRNFVAKNYLWLSLLGNSFWGICAIILSHYLCDYGGHGRAASFAIAYGLNTIIFIPFYCRKKLCPKYILVSRYSILIWVIIIFNSIIGFFMRSGMLYRFILLLLSYCLISFLIKRMWAIVENFRKGELVVFE